MMRSVMQRGWFDVLWLVAFGIASTVWCIATARQLGATYDEPAYLEQGLVFWRTGSHRQLMRMGTMPLPMDVQTLPLAVTERFRGEAWDVDADCRRILPWMRHGNLVFWWLLLIVGYRFGRDLGGTWGGRLAVAVIACEPNLLAHASLATTDVAVAACLVGLAGAFHRGRDGDRWRRVGLPGLWFGFALLAKASTLVFGPIVLLAVEAVRWQKQRDGSDWKTSAWPFLGDSVRIGLIGLAIAFVGCGTSLEPDETFVTWAKSLPEGPARTAWVWVAKHLKIFGNAGEALVTQVKHNLRGHGQFLLGDWGSKPFWYYFPVLFTIKLPAAVLASAATLLITRPLTWFRNPALVTATLLLAVSLSCRVQIGLRLQLPCLAFLVIGLASELPGLAIGASTAVRRLSLVAATVMGITWIGFGAATIWPHGLCYVNELWGGPERGYLLAGDSNYDWGQGLPELDDWHRRSGRVPLDVWYFGRDPALKRMPVRDLPLHCVTLPRPEDTATFCWGRYLAVSTTLTHGYRIGPAHGNALRFLQGRTPVARTTTFLIYDLTNVGPPNLVANRVEPERRE